MDRVEAIFTACKTRAGNMRPADTGMMDLAATADGYERLTGSFVDDGFVAGMEVTEVGFAANAVPALIEEVEPLSMLVRGGRSLQVAASGRQIYTGFPGVVLESNFANYKPEPNVQFVELELTDNRGQMISFPADGGTVLEEGFFLVRWYGINETGWQGLSRCMAALEARFTPGTNIALPDGTFVKVRTDMKAIRSVIRNQDSGHALQTLSVPFERYAVNVVLP